MYMRTRKKQNCVNGVDFLQYYKKKQLDTLLAQR